ncbi:MAG: peptidase M15 [Pseudomonadota bacterium]
MRIATSLAFILAASILPATLLPAQAQNADDTGAASGISTSHYSQFGPFRTAQSEYSARRGASASRGCLTSETRALLSRFEARFGTVKVISTCRPGAVIAGSGRPSQHRYGKAVDFMPKPGQRAAMLAWLRANANGAVITYGSGHIHFDTGGYRNFAVSAKARRAYARAR